MTTIYFKVNCGFARAAIREFSEVRRGKQPSKQSQQTRIEKFRELFSSTRSYVTDDSIFNGYDHRDPPFTRYCKSIIDSLVKWKACDQKSDYLKTFCTENWKKLPVYQKKKHTLDNCKGCALHYMVQQEKFPGPTFRPTMGVARSVQILIKENAGEKNPAATTTRQILDEIEPQYQQTYNTTFTECITKEPGTKVRIKPTATKRKRTKRKIRRECRDSINEQYRETDPLQILSEGQSLQAYKGMRLSQSFQTPPKSSGAQSRKHSPNFDKVEWDKDKLFERLSNWPEGETINWTQTAKEFHIQGSNKGQIVEEFAIENGIDVTKLDQRPKKKRARARKLKLPGAGISVPTHPTVKEIKDEWQNMLNDGELTLGEPCHPQTITRISIADGELKQTENVGKFPCLTLEKSC